MKAYDHTDLLGTLGAPGERERPPLASVRDWPRDGKDQAEGRLAEQLGPLWTDIDALSAERRSVVDMLVARRTDGRSAEEACRRAAGRHAYETGVILTLASECGMAGGSPAWGLPHGGEPVLRAIAAGHGRSSVPIEAFGAVAHWLAEREAGKPLERPTLDIAALVVAELANDQAERPPVNVALGAWS